MTTTTSTSITSSTVTPSQMPITTTSAAPTYYTTSSDLSASILNRPEASVEIPTLNEDRNVSVISSNESESSNLSERTLPSSNPDEEDGCFDESSDEDSIEMQRGVILAQIMASGQTWGVIDLGIDEFDEWPGIRQPRFNPPPIKKNPTSSRSNSTEKSSHIAQTSSFSSSSTMSAPSAIPNEISEDAKFDGEEDLVNTVSNSTDKSSHIVPMNSSFSSMSATSDIPNEISEDAKFDGEEDLLNSVLRFIQKMTKSIKF